MTNLDSILKSRDITLPTKVCSVKTMVFPVVVYDCESWTIKKLSTKELMLLNCGVGEDSWETLDCKEIKPVLPKGTQSWIFIGWTEAKVETPILWQPDAKNWLIGKYPDVGKDWRQEEKGITEDEMVGWHLWLDRHEFEQTPGVGDGQGGLACCSPWGHKELDTTKRLNWTELTGERTTHAQALLEKAVVLGREENARGFFGLVARIRIARIWVNICLVPAVQVECLNSEDAPWIKGLGTRNWQFWILASCWNACTSQIIKGVSWGHCCIAPGNYSGLWRMWITHKGCRLLSSPVSLLGPALQLQHN